MGRRLLVLVVVSLLAFAGSALAAKGDPKHAFTPAGQKLAKSIALKLSDLPAGFKATPAGPDSGATPRCSIYNPDQSDLTVSGTASSPDFNGPSGLPYISSEVDVFVSATQAKAGYGRVVRPALAACLAELFSKSAPKGMKFAVPSAKTRPLHGVGDKATLITLNATATQGKLRLPFVVHVGAINKGAVDALFIAVNLGGPYAGTQALIAKLASRMP